jgi:protein tyrosine/serine phosphatase
MQDVVDGNNIYFHCAIGTDRTGTMAYFLEGLLGVSLEDKLEDYELSYFYGLLNRNRLHDNLSGSSINPRFKSMSDKYNTNAKIYEWFMAALETQEERDAADDLIEAFRNAMIDKY